MPKTKTGKKIYNSMVKKYGKKKGKEVYYKSIVKGVSGSSKWENLKSGSGRLLKARKTYLKKKKRI